MAEFNIKEADVELTMDVKYYNSLDIEGGLSY